MYFKQKKPPYNLCMTAFKTSKLKLFYNKLLAYAYSILLYEYHVDAF